MNTSPKASALGGYLFVTLTYCFVDMYTTPALNAPGSLITKNPQLIKISPNPKKPNKCNNLPTCILLTHKQLKTKSKKKRGEKKERIRNNKRIRKNK